MPAYVDHVSRVTSRHDYRSRTTCRFVERWHLRQPSTTGLAEHRGDAVALAQLVAERLEHNPVYSSSAAYAYQVLMPWLVGQILKWTLKPGARTHFIAAGNTLDWAGRLLKVEAHSRHPAAVSHR
jgi:hypothetical protein